MEWPLGKDDMFIILASDGVWEFIDSDEVKRFTFLECKYGKRLLCEK